MATYGKQKKGLLSSFSLLQDEKPEQPEQRSTSRRLSKANAKMQKPRNLAKSDDESIDELAGDALLATIPQGPISAGLFNSQAALENTSPPKSSKSIKTIADDYDKVLLRNSPGEPRHDQGAQKPRPALATKTNNLRSPKQGERLSAKPAISHPIPLDASPTTKSMTPESPSVHFAVGAASPKTTTSDAAEISRKLLSLMQQAADQEAETKSKADAYTDASKPSPLQRGKKAFVKATRALKDRLGNGNGESSRGSKDFLRKHPHTGRDNGPHQSYETTEKDQRAQLNRRIAEGENLGNPKIQSLMGDGKIPRRPLPVYQSMKSRNQESELPDDLFSEAKVIEGRSTSQDLSGFDVDSNRRKQTIKNSQNEECLPAREETEHAPETSGYHMPVAKNNFSNMISGLAQQSDPGFYSSRPIAYSTPRIRLNPQSTDDERTALVHCPPILEAGFEGSSEDEQSVSPSGTSKAVTDGSAGAKRKNSEKNFRSQLSPAPKKAKVSAGTSKEDTGLADAISQLDAEDDRASFSPTDQASSVLPATPKVRKGKGLAIFDLGKGKAPEQKEKKPRSRGMGSKRSLLSQPSIGSSRGESRVKTERLTAMDGDSMDIDELQADDDDYQGGGMKK